MATATLDFAPDDIVQVSPVFADAKSRGRKFKITKVNRVTVKASEIETGANWVFQKYQVEKVGRATDATYASLIKEVEEQGVISLGTVVRVKGAVNSAKWNYKDGAFFVAIKWDYNKNEVHIALLGGEGGRFWRFSPSRLEVVKVPGT